jgi:hypothetical protein
MKCRADFRVENDGHRLGPSASRIMRGLDLFREPVESGPRSSQDQPEQLALRASPQWKRITEIAPLPGRYGDAGCNKVLTSA